MSAQVCQSPDDSSQSCPQSLQKEIYKYRKTKLEEGSQTKLKLVSNEGENEDFHAMTKPYQLKKTNEVV